MTDFFIEEGSHDADVYQDMLVLPPTIQADWRAQVRKATPIRMGHVRLVAARTTEPGSWEEQRVVVLVVDENGIGVPGIKVAFAFSTADLYILDQGWEWAPPGARSGEGQIARAEIVATKGGGEIDMVQGSAVKPGNMGGMDVWVHHPKLSSDVVLGAGMKADHTGLHLTFQLQRVHRLPSLAERIVDLENRVKLLESK